MYCTDICNIFKGAFFGLLTYSLTPHSLLFMRRLQLETPSIQTSSTASIATCKDTYVYTSALAVAAKSAACRAAAASLAATSAAIR